MKRIKITGKKALKALTAAMDERGEGFRFADMFDEGVGCFYGGIPKNEAVEWDEDGKAVGERTPACLVGLAFHIIDPELDQFTMEDGNNEQAIATLFGGDRYSPNSAPDESEVRWGDMEIVATKKALMALTAAQECQDQGGTWGEAVERAIQAVS